MNRFLIVAMGLLLSACAASGSVQGTSANPPVLDSAKAGAVEVATALPNTNESVDALKSALISQIVNKKVFKSIDADGADYLLKVNVVDITEVSQPTRLLLGALAGRAGITANVDILDRKGGTVIGSMVATGRSSGGNIFAGTTQEAIDQAATQITDYLLRNRKMP